MPVNNYEYYPFNSAIAWKLGTGDWTLDTCSLHFFLIFLLRSVVGSLGPVIGLFVWKAACACTSLTPTYLYYTHTPHHHLPPAHPPYPISCLCPPSHLPIPSPYLPTFLPPFLPLHTHPTHTPFPHLPHLCTLLTASPSAPTFPSPPHHCLPPATTFHCTHHTHTCHPQDFCSGRQRGRQRGEGRDRRTGTFAFGLALALWKATLPPHYLLSSLLPSAPCTAQARALWGGGAVGGLGSGWNDSSTPHHCCCHVCVCLGMCVYFILSSSSLCLCPSSLWWCVMCYICHLLLLFIMMTLFIIHCYYYSGWHPFPMALEQFLALWPFFCMPAHHWHLWHGWLGRGILWLAALPPSLPQKLFTLE